MKRVIVSSTSDAREKVAVNANSKLSIKGLMGLMDSSVKLSVRKEAAKILYNWYRLEGEDYLPDEDDIMDMCDAATNADERSIVLDAIGWSDLQDEDDEDW